MAMALRARAPLFARLGERFGINLSYAGAPAQFRTPSRIAVLREHHCVHHKLRRSNLCGELAPVIHTPY